MMEHGIIFENCALWDSARVLARDRGFIMGKGCPIEEVCEETYCPFVTPPSEVTAEKVEEFYRKAEKYLEAVDQKRLAELRQELDDELTKMRLEDAYQEGFKDGLEVK